MEINFLNLFLKKILILKHLIATILLLNVFHTSSAQYTSLGAENYAMANSLVAFPNRTSIYNNPAGMSFFKETSLGLSYFRVLPVEGFNTLGAWATTHKKGFSFGFSADSFGDQFYKESRAGLAISKKLDKVSMGLKFSILNNKIEEVSSKQTFLGEFGIIVTPHRFFNLGLHVVNFTRASLYSSQDLPTIVSTGAILNLSKSARFSIQLDYPLNRKPELRTGLQYTVRPNLKLMTGINPVQKTVHFGLGGVFDNKSFDYAVATMPSVGLSHQFSLHYKIRGK